MMPTTRSAGSARGMRMICKRTILKLSEQVRASALLAALFFVATISTGNETFDCPSSLASVTASEEEHVWPICEAARKAARLFAECGIVQRRPFHVFVVTDLPPECPAHALGFFDARTQRVVVPTYKKCVELTEKMERFGVPMTRSLYRSLIVHELTHAIATQTSPTTRLNVAGHEYIAYVFQLLSMDSALRGQILRKYPHSSRITVRQLNETYFYLSPPHFAVKSYIHFRTPGNGCRFISDLLYGKTKLPSGQR